MKTPNHNSLLFAAVVGIFLALFVAGVSSSVGAQTPQPADTPINKRPLRDLASVLKQKDANQFDLNAPFLVEFKGILGPDGKYVAKDSKFTRVEGNETSTELAKRTVEAVNDSGRFSHFSNLGSTDIVIVLTQGESEFSVHVTLLFKDEVRARSVASSFNLLLAMARQKSPTGDGDDTRDLQLLDATRVSTDGRNVNINVSLPKAVFHEMIKRSEGEQHPVTQRKNQNSILVLATLGVYLGLVLAGATPQILAQAAMAREFNIKDESKKKDGLDNKPPDNFAASVQVYLEDVEYFLDGLQRLHTDRKFDIGTNRFEIAQATLLPCIADNRAGSYTAEKFFTSNQLLRPTLERFSNLLTDGYSLQDCLPSEKFPGLEATSSRFETRLDGTEFSVEIAVAKSSPERAAALAQTLAATFNLFRSGNPTLVRTKLIDNTQARAAGSHVFVVTRLPRAGLVSLLSKDAK